MGRLNRDQKQLFYAFDLDEAVPNDHPIREIAQVLDLSWVRNALAPYYSHTGRPSIDPELMLRILILGYVFAIRSERQLVRDVQVNLAYRWFCGLGIEDRVPEHSAFSRARNERFRDSNILREFFEQIVLDCIEARLVGGEGLAVDASLIEADANKCRSIPGKDWKKNRSRETASRAVREYLDTLDDAAFGAASDVTPKFVSRSDPAAQRTGAMKGKAFFAYADDYLIDTQHGIIMDVEATRAIRQAEVGASHTMLERTEQRFGIKPRWLAGLRKTGNHLLPDEWLSSRNVAIRRSRKRYDQRHPVLSNGFFILRLPTARFTQYDDHSHAYLLVVLIQLTTFSDPVVPSGSTASTILAGRRALSVPVDPQTSKKAPHTTTRAGVIADRPS